MSKQLLQSAIKEVSAIHAFFVGWFRTGASHPDLSEIEQVLAPDFRMISPDGLASERKGVIDAIRNGRGLRGADFAITIVDPRPVVEFDGAVLLEFIEQQYRDGRTTRRLSTALFTPEESAPRGVLWRHLHETWVKD